MVDTLRRCSGCPVRGAGFHHRWDVQGLSWARLRLGGKCQLAHLPIGKLSFQEDLPLTRIYSGGKTVSTITGTGKTGEPHVRG